MNCVELQRSLTETEDGSRADQKSHLKTCPDCSSLVAELNLIAATAPDLRGVHEPSPRVWNSIEIALRKEGLIRPQPAGRSVLPGFSSHWGWARWLAPAAAILLVAAGIYVRQHSLPQQVASTYTAPSPEVSDAGRPALNVALKDDGLNDDDLLQEVAAQSPAMQAQYTDNLRRVNQYIEDAKSNLAAYPNDEEARRSLLAAYQEKAMLFEFGMDHPQP